MLHIHSANDLLFVKRIKEAGRLGSDKFSLALLNVIDEFIRSIYRLAR